MLHDGSIAEMKTGEGKTLVSTLAAYLNALTGDGVHGMFSRFFGRYESGNKLRFETGFLVNTTVWCHVFE